MGSVTIVLKLPRRLLNTRNCALIGELAEADAAKIEVSHIAVLAAAAKAASNHARLELRLTLGSDDD